MCAPYFICTLDVHYSFKLVKQPPSTMFPSPSGGAPPSAPFLLETKIGVPSAEITALGGGKIHGPIGTPSLPKMVLNLPQGYDDSEYVLSFEIGQRESGFYRTQTDGRTDRKTDGQTHSVPYSNIDSFKMPKIF